MSAPILAEKLFRFDDSFEGEGMWLKARILLTTYNVVSTTPRGWWISHWGGKKWVASGDGKRFAYPTREAAIESYRHRKRRQVLILSARLNRARKAQIAATDTRNFPSEGTHSDMVWS